MGEHRRQSDRDAQTGDAQDTEMVGSGDSQSGNRASDDKRQFRRTGEVSQRSHYPLSQYSPIDVGLIDPITGADVGGDITMGDSPINNNLLNQQNE